MGKLDLIDVIEDDNSKDFELSDEMAIQQEESLERGRKEIFDIQQKKIQKLDEEIKDLQQDREQRKVLSYALFRFMCFYMFIVLVIVFCCGFGWMHISDKVLIVLLTTTLADVIGIFGFVAKYLYHK
jgi:hypothetical protein